MHRRSVLPFVLLFWIAALLAGCASGPRHVEVSRERLQAALQRRFPYEVPAGLFVVDVGVPQLQLQPQENRLRLDFPVEAGGGIVRPALHGTLAVSFGLRFEPSDSSLRMVAARVEDVRVQGVPASWREPLQAIGGLVAAQVLQDAVLHTFGPQDLARARGWTPGDIRVTPAGVDIELLPPSAEYEKGPTLAGAALGAPAR